MIYKNKWYIPQNLNYFFLCITSMNVIINIRYWMGNIVLNIEITYKIKDKRLGMYSILIFPLANKK